LAASMNTSTTTSTNGRINESEKTNNDISSQPQQSANE
jgi:hypothetical protein